MNRLLPLLAVACMSPAVSAQFLLVVDSANDRVLQLSDFDGSVINADFIDLDPATPGTPIEAIVVNDEIWISDQVGDKLIRFSLDGTTWLGNVTGGMDNIRGFEFVNGEVFVSNSGSNGGAPGDAIVRFSPAGTNLGSFPVSDPFDVLAFQGNLMSSDISGEDLLLHNYAGTALTPFHVSVVPTGINFPEQLTLRANGNVLAAGFSSPAGIFEYDPTGVQINYWAVGTTMSGVHELGNGQILFTSGNTGIRSYDPVSTVTTVILGGFNGRFISKYGGASPGTVYCTGDGSGTACPCGNNSPLGAGEGCLSSLAMGGKLIASGSASLAADSVVLHGAQMPDSSALYFQGTTQLGGGAGVAFGDGLRCVGGTINRLKPAMNVGGASQFPDVGDASVSVKGNIAAPGTFNYQVWYRNAAAFCTASTFNLTNGVQVVWGP